MTDVATHQSLLAAVERYFETMFDGDLDRFDQVFAATAQLHGLRDGSLRVLPASDYRKLLAANPSPKSKNAPRQQEILLIDFASVSQALVKVRVRIDAILYVDYLSYHCIDGAWLITAKSFHIERRFEDQGRGVSAARFISMPSVAARGSGHAVGEAGHQPAEHRFGRRG